MEERFDVYTSHASASSNPMAAFVSDQLPCLSGDFQQLPEFEPDALFFEESWSLGASAAMEGWRRRHGAEEDRDRRSRAFREFDRMANIVFLQPDDSEGDLAPSPYAAYAVGLQSADWPRGSAQSFPSHVLDRPAQSWTPPEWTPQDRVPHSEIPYNRMPQGWLPRDETPRQPDSYTEPCESGMTPRQACRLLGVSPTMGREQLRSAYRRMVTQWHPDRLEGSSEEELNFATERMAEINLAYRLLLQGLSLNAA